MNEIAVIFYDGVVSKAYSATLSAVSKESIQICYENHGRQYRQYSASEMSFIGALGQKFPVIELKDDARIEFLSAEVPGWLPGRHKKFQQKIWTLERTPALILFSVVFVLMFGFALVKWGIPSLAKVVAFQMPENSLNHIGQQAEDMVLKDYTATSHLPAGQQQQIRDMYLRQIAGDCPAKLIFREGGRIGANALALPNNTIIITDELVEMAHSDQEILGVLAHEQGHLIERHSLQQALSSLGVSVVFIAVTGDASDLFSSLPVALLGAGYSRKFEQQADLYALKLMDRQHIEVSHFANFLQRMEDEQSGSSSDEKKSKAQGSRHSSEPVEDNTSALGSMIDVLSSHPATVERIQMVRDFEKQQKK